MDKLDIHTIAGLTRYAIRKGLTTLEQQQHQTSEEGNGEIGDSGVDPRARSL